MLKYQEILDKIEAISGQKKFIDTYLYGQVMTTNPEHFAEAMLKIIGFGFQIGGREIGRVSDEGEGDGLTPNKAERDLIMEDFTRHSLNALSLTYTILVQIPLADSVSFMQKSVEHLFDIGYRIVKMQLPDDGSYNQPTPNSVTEEPSDDLPFDFSDTDIDFLNKLSGRFNSGEEE